MKIEQLQKEMINSMKSKNHMRKAVISDIIATAKNMAIAQKCKDNISESIVQEAILKAKKTCQEQIDICPESRADKMVEYVERMKYIDEFAPKMMSEEELRKEVAILLDGFTETPSKGSAMKILMPILKGRADGKLINKIVDEMLRREK